MGGLGGIIWIVGIFFMIRYGFWWPGILVLIGITAMLGSMWRETPPPPAPPTIGNPPAPASPQAPAPIAPPAPIPLRPAPANSSEHRVDLLPATCGRCGAPMRAQDVKWTGPKSASCPYCGSTLNMTGSQGKQTPPPTWNF
jgi:hypothetical protein